MTFEQRLQQLERDWIRLIPSIYASEIMGGLLWIRRH